MYLSFRPFLAWSIRRRRRRKRAVMRRRRSSAVSDQPPDRVYKTRTSVMKLAQ
jgi:hypothetical protein